MQLSKVSCMQCKQYDSCPQKTRMYVNYCGSMLSSVQDNIRAAVTECRSKRGKMLKTIIFSTTASSKKLLSSASDF